MKARAAYDLEAKVRAWLVDLDITIPDPKPFGLRDGEIVDTWDEDDDDVYVIYPDTPTIDDLASGIASMARDAAETFPGRRNWRRWRLTGAVATRLYVLGITSSGGGTAWCGRDPIGGPIHDLPRLRSVWSGRRCYILGLPLWWWECQRRQGLRLAGRHRPALPFAFGVCARCVPCPDCGAAYDCADNCPSLVPASSEDGTR